MNHHQSGELNIEVFDDPTYTFGSIDNLTNYLKCHFSENGRSFPVSKHGIRIVQNNRVVNNAVIIGSGGATGIHPGSSIVINDELLICCCNTVFCLSIPALDVKWKVKADLATCFRVLYLDGDYLIHGELSITRLGKSGNIKWQFSGKDIFVSTDGEAELKLDENRIYLRDFEGNNYILDFNGNPAGSDS